MQPQDLTTGLTNTQPAVRIRTAQLIGTLDEVGVLDAVSAAYKTESNERVKKVMAWAGKRLHTAKKNGMDTNQEIVKYFGVDRAVRNQIDLEGAQLLDQIRYNMEMSSINRRQKGVVGKTASNALVGSLFMGPAGSMLTSLAGMGQLQDATGRSTQPSYTLPRRPTNDDIAPYIDMLKADNPRQRQEGIAGFYQVNNLAALPHLGLLFYVEQDAPVKEQAGQVAKGLYWNALFWQMHQDGQVESFIGEYAQRYAQMNDLLNELDADIPPTQSGQAPAGDIDDILKKAEEARKKRRRRR